MQTEVKEKEEPKSTCKKLMAKVRDIVMSDSTIDDKITSVLHMVVKELTRLAFRLFSDTDIIEKLLNLF